jgi:hypothetical protein
MRHMNSEPLSTLSKHSSGVKEISKSDEVILSMESSLVKKVKVIEVPSVEHVRQIITKVGWKETSWTEIPTLRLPVA